MGNGKPMVVSEDARKEMTEEDDYRYAVVSKNTYCIKFFWRYEKHGHRHPNYMTYCRFRNLCFIE